MIGIRSDREWKIKELQVAFGKFMAGLMSLIELRNYLYRGKKLNLNNSKI